MSLPNGVKDSDITAESDNGVLEISVPGVAGTNGKPPAKTIPVKKAAKPLKA